jgi:hypothetical protein
MTRGDQFRASADAAEASAAAAFSPDLKRQFHELAVQWRDLARQADDYDAAVKPEEDHSSSR